MKNIDLNIILGCFIVSLGLIISGFLISQSLDNDLEDIESVMNLEEVAVYLNITESEVIDIIITEKKMKDYNYGIEWLPYFKIDDNYYFYKTSIDIWLLYVSERGVEYNTKTHFRDY